MKKIVSIILALMMVLSLAACGSKEDPNTSNNTNETPVSSENTSFPEADPAEYSREYWEEKYPGENICPFYIEENGTEYSYYWVSGFDGWNGTMESWISQPFNWNGWHKTDNGCIVNKDETLKITDNWANGDESLSSGCTVTTEKYDKDNAGNQNTEVSEDLPFTTDNCRKAAKDGNLYESEFTSEHCTVFELDSGAAINIVQFVYKTAGHTVFLTASESGSVENAFSCNFFFQK